MLFFMENVPVCLEICEILAISDPITGKDKFVFISTWLDPCKVLRYSLFYFYYITPKLLHSATSYLTSYQVRLGRKLHASLYGLFAVR